MFISLTGPSAIGKGYIKKYLTHKIPGLEEVSWLTTRPLRNEETGKLGNRTYIDQNKFLSLKEDGEIAFFQNLYGFYYGLHKSSPCFRQQGLWITEFHVNNLLAAQKTIPNLCVLGLIPDRMELLSTRIKKRNSETKVQVEQRLEAAKNEIEKIKQKRKCFDKIFVINPKNEKKICSEVHLFLLKKLSR